MSREAEPQVPVARKYPMTGVVAFPSQRPIRTFRQPRPWHAGQGAPTKATEEAQRLGRHGAATPADVTHRPKRP